MRKQSLASGCSRRSFLALGFVSMHLASSPIKACSSLSSQPTLGFNLVEWDNGANSDTDRWTQAINDIFAIGIRRVSLVSYWFIDPSTAEVHELSQNDLPHGPTPEVLAAAMRAAHELGMSVSLKPLIEIDSNKGGRLEWRGSLRIRQEGLESFFNSYEAYIQRMAELAAAGGAEVFYIGSELASLTKDKATLPHWTALIDRLRHLFPGRDRRLSYAANYDEYDNVPFWNQLDEIGIDAYFPLATQEEIRESGNPDTKTMIRRWREIFSDLRAYSENQGRQITFSEFGLIPYKYASTQPWNYWGRTEFDPTEQLNGFESLLTAIQTEGHWLNGIDFWHWQLATASGSKYNIATNTAIGKLIAHYATYPN